VTLFAPRGLIPERTSIWQASLFGKKPLSSKKA
jgi:hypothetical protein